MRGTIRESFGDRLFLYGIYAFLALIGLAVFYPLLYIVSASFSAPQAVIEGRVWLLPVEPTLLGYKTVFEHHQVIVGYMNSAFYTFFGTMMNVALTIMLAYPLSKRNFYGRQAIMMILVATMLFEGGLIPYYLTIKSLGILDTRWAMLLPQALAVWQVIIARTFFHTTIPEELTEAAELDGCSNIGFIWRVVVPLSKPIIAVLVLMYAVMHWNSYFDALIFLKSADLFPLQIVLRNILILNSVDTTAMKDASEMLARQGLKDLLKFSLIVVASAPILAIYPFVQKYFVQGIMIGSIKG
ncbi:carbohydrate ABC transporter permease [Paenibacillus antri]|uniref:Carbohydrate ABC transporter permease n=1 Tax=Paenibacillus antri TaxID=2582848 RepID=A0A5R9GCB7_9BACL|nr:carbohydrate ABC transporter permease [Paenibacillus antri]TLS54117.1 carbohydrate ABC transporter permease [Paenibacillus antri]